MAIRPLIWKLRQQWFWKSRWHLLALATIAVFIAEFRIGPIDRFTFDLAAVLSGSRPPLDIVVVELDSVSKRALNQLPDRPLDRAIYAEAVRRLKREGARVVAFDLIFDTPSDSAKDADFAQALREHGAAVLAAEITSRDETTHASLAVIKPIDILRTNAAGWGSAAVAVDPDRVVRRHMVNPELAPSLASSVVRLLGQESPIDFEINGVAPPPRLLKWYPPGVFRRLDFAELMQSEQSLQLSNRIVVIGEKTGVGLPGTVSDTFGSPWSRFGQSFVSGATVQSTIIANYAARRWLTPASTKARIFSDVLLAVSAMLFAWRLNARGQWMVWIVPVAFAIVTSLGTIVLHRYYSVWWPCAADAILTALIAAFWLRWKPAPLPIDVFISYRRQVDGETAELLYRELCVRKVVAFYAPETMPPGLFDKHLARKIRNSRHVLFILSSKTFARDTESSLPGPNEDWVRFELANAKRAGKELLVLLKGASQVVEANLPHDLRELFDWPKLTNVNYQGDGRIGTAVEQIAKHARSE